MGREAREYLGRALSEHLNTIHETLQVLDQTPASSLEKVSWNEVIKLGEQVSKQATTIGMFLTGETPEIKALEGSMASYFNTLQGFLLVSHGSMVGAGPTLSSCINTSVKQVVDCSFMLLKESVSSYGACNDNYKHSIPQLVGTVWDACSALKKTPATNITAIGRAMTRIAVSMKDVLREMKELKLAPSEQADEAIDGALTKTENELLDSDNVSMEELGNDLSPEEMKVALLTTDVVSDALVVVKELIRSLTNFLKENSDNSSIFVDAIEGLLKLCQGLGLQIDEFGACLYPPQEVAAMKAASEKASSCISEMQVVMENLKGSSEAFVRACAGLSSSLKQLESELDFSTAGNLVPKMQNLVMTS